MFSGCPNAIQLIRDMGDMLKERLRQYGTAWQIAMFAM